MNRATLGVRCHRIKKYIPIYLMLLPGAIYLLINNYIPMAGIVMAFKISTFPRVFGEVTGWDSRTLSIYSKLPKLLI